MHPDIAPGGHICEWVFMWCLCLVLVKEAGEQGEVGLDISLYLH